MTDRELGRPVIDSFQDSVALYWSVFYRKSFMGKTLDSTIY